MPASSGKYISQNNWPIIVDRLNKAAIKDKEVGKVRTDVFSESYHVLDATVTVETSEFDSVNPTHSLQIDALNDEKRRTAEGKLNSLFQEELVPL